MVDSHFDNNVPESCIEFNNHSKTNASREMLEKLESYKNYLITLE